MRQIRLWPVCLILIVLFAIPAQAASPTCGTSMGPIYPGTAAYPSDVSAVTSRLKQLGYTVPTTDGIYDLQLQAVIRQFQKDKGLEVNSIIDDATILALAGNASTWVPASTTTLPEGKIRIEVDSVRMNLTVYVNDQVFKKYPVAVGRPSLRSPIGDWKVVSKGVNWGGGFGTRWLGLNVPWGIYGIHGTNKPYSIGQMASHGCIRMLNQNVEELYRWIPIGTPVKIIGPPPPVKYGRLIQMGNTGKDVVGVQMQLQALGFRDAGADGRYGPATTQATRSLQRLYGLPEDGAVYEDVYYILGLK